MLKKIKNIQKIKNPQETSSSRLSRGQTLLEYSMLLGVLTAVLFAMGTGLKRQTQSMIRFMADEIGNQECSEQSFEKDDSFVNVSFESYFAHVNKVTRDRLMVTTYDHDDYTAKFSKVNTNLGFTEDAGY